MRILCQKRDQMILPKYGYDVGTNRFFKYTCECINGVYLGYDFFVFGRETNLNNNSTIGIKINLDSESLLKKCILCRLCCD